MKTQELARTIAGGKGLPYYDSGRGIPTLLEILNSNLLELNPKELQILNDGGYFFDLEYGKVAAGCTREVYVFRKKGSEFVAKIPKEEINGSVNALINESRGDTNKNEADILRDVNHPNISKVVDSIVINGKRINLEPLYGYSLEDYIKDGSQFYYNIDRIMEQIVSGVKYLNLDKGILHRDLKPSNIVMGLDGKIKITDLQLAKRIEDIESRFLPTRGGATYMHPDLLNAFICKDKKASASLRTEVYSIGAIMLYLLNPEGFKKNLNYKIIESEDGTPIKINGKEVSISLIRSNPSMVGPITKEEHEKRLKQALNSRAIMQKYRRIIYKAMTLNEKESYNDISEFEKDLKDSRNYGMTFKERIWALFNEQDANRFGYLRRPK